MAGLEPNLDDAQRAALIVLIAAVLVGEAEGSTRIPLMPIDGCDWLGDFLTRLDAALAKDDESADEGAEDDEDGVEREHDRAPKFTDLRAQIADLIETPLQLVGASPDEARPLVLQHPWLATQKLAAAEKRTSQLVAGLRTRHEVGEPALEAAIEDVLSRPPRLDGAPLRPTDEQLDAVRLSARSGALLLSGGPGTGKTFTVASILRVLLRLGVSMEDIALAAPTGKAAHRMRESISAELAAVADPSEVDSALQADCPAPKTLHRLLGYSPARNAFRHHKNNRLSSRVIVVDESSMIDIALIERLVGATSTDARLIFLGDADQLPPVGAGAPFRDLVRARALPTVRLTYSHRMREDDPAGRAILTAANEIRDGRVPVIPARSSIRALTRDGIERIEVEGRKGATLAELVTDIYARSFALDDEALGWARSGIVQRPDGFDDATTERLTALFAHLSRGRVLCVTRRKARGSVKLNAAFHEHAASAIGHWRPFLPGEPVMVVENDYPHNLFNGDQGVVLLVQTEGDGPVAPMAIFERSSGFQAFHVRALADRLELGYALTVHKAQGGEFDEVVLMLPEKDIPLLSRELAYTAITRARASVVVVGQAELLGVAAKRPERRFSGLRVGAPRRR